MSIETGILRVQDSGITPLERPERAGSASFGAELTKAIGEVDQLQLDADAQATKLAEGGGNLHETALALEKADVSMRVLTKARNKLIDAYQEIMRMSV